MGGRGSFLESGGFSTPYEWETVSFIENYKVLEPKDKSKSFNLPEFSNTPGTVYVSLYKDGTFHQLRVFSTNRHPMLDIDYSPHQGKLFLHYHIINGNLSKRDAAVPLKPGDLLYEKYKNLFIGVKL